MSFCKYFIPIWVIIAVYSLLSLYAGERGILAYEQLNQERERLLANKEALRLRNEELEGRKNALLYDSDTIAAYARELGYGTRGERFIRIVGISGTRKQDNAPGQVLIAGEPHYIPQATIRLIALGSGVGLLLCLLVYDFLGKGRTIA
ncbi:MAG: septum formation initiator family protein [Treponema sp.]|jgi:cell division protein FtsB|nr:septum formation initiator family protein [Treponema sp.]